MGEQLQKSIDNEPMNKERQSASQTSDERVKEAKPIELSKDGSAIEVSQSFNVSRLDKSAVSETK